MYVCLPRVGTRSLSRTVAYSLVIVDVSKHESKCFLSVGKIPGEIRYHKLFPVVNAFLHRTNHVTIILKTNLTIVILISFIIINKWII